MAFFGYFLSPRKESNPPEAKKGSGKPSGGVEPRPYARLPKAPVSYVRGDVGIAPYENAKCPCVIRAGGQRRPPLQPPTGRPSCFSLPFRASARREASALGVHTGVGIRPPSQHTARPALAGRALSHFFRFLRHRTGSFRRALRSAAFSCSVTWGTVRRPCHWPSFRCTTAIRTGNRPCSPQQNVP